MPPPDLESAVVEFLAALRRENASPHTVRSYASDLRQFCEYFSPPGAKPLTPAEFDTWKIREWLADLYSRNISAVSARRKLAALRTFFGFLVKQGVIEVNAARLAATPKAPQTLPAVMTEEQASALIESVRPDHFERPFPERDRAIFEILYGCGVRVSELAGLNLEDVDFEECWLRVRGKGRKEREAPFGSKAAEALDRYLPLRKGGPRENALFTNYRGTRLSVRAIHSIVKFYAKMALGDSSVHPHSFRHACATHLLRDGADLRAIQELLGHARLSTTQKYTQLSLADLMAVYDRAHPKAKG
jgi:integrase/recombinase XerC